MVWLILLLLFALLLTLILKGTNVMCDDIEETTTTVIHESGDTPNVVGNLKRQVEGIQSFVMDPVDGEKIWLNSNDDMYEDANGKIWRLV